jgi:2-iminobutanoate/2-iminopropanoate deaminase
VRVTVYLADIGDFDAMNRAYSTEFQAPYPARSTVQVEMPFGALVGIEVTAYRSLKGSAIESKQNDAE